MVYKGVVCVITWILSIAKEWVVECVRAAVSVNIGSSHPINPSPNKCHSKVTQNGWQERGVWEV